MCTVLKSNSSVLFLSAKRSAVSSARINRSTKVKLGNIIAGSFVEAKITSILNGGLRASVFGMFDAVMEASHCQHLTNLDEYYNIGQKINCRLLWVDLGEKTFGLSNANHWRDFSTIGFEFPIGEIVNIKVKMVDFKIGLVVEMENRDQLGFIHVPDV